MIHALNIFAIVNLTLLALLIGVRKVNTTANKLFALVIFTPATDFIINYLVYTGEIYTVPYIVFFNISFLWGPLLIWYVLRMLDYEVPLTIKTGIHFLPQLLSWAFWIHASLQGNAYMNHIFERRAAYDYPLPLVIFQMIVLSQIIGYTSYCTYKIYKHQYDPSNTVTAAKIKWLKQFMHLLVTLGVLNILCFFPFSSADNDYIITPLLYMVFYCVVVYKSFASFGVFPDAKHSIHVREELVQEDVLQKEKYVTSGLKAENVTTYKQTLLDYLEKNEPYVNPELSLAELATSINIPQHQLSQLINQEFDKNFADLVNSYRVEKSKKLMTDPAMASLTLEAIGLQSGFGSPSAFYRAFKKHTAITPRAFLKGNATGK
ncbi:MAG: AraC family transcriptional regulator [Chitinophagaceae bacterium]|nr:MAG: AraC family transcriptional regulator [Chitinophagaceae bacterium]